MKKAVGLAIMASLFASSAIAGETFVRNETIHRTSRTKTSLNINTVTNSNRTEHYDSYSEKISIDGNVAKSVNSSTKPNLQQFVNGSSTLKLSNLMNDDNYAEAYGVNGLTIHRSGSSLKGTFIEDTTTNVTGTVYSVVNETYRSHETTAGVR